MKTSNPLSQALIPAIDKIVEVRYEPARLAVEKLQRAHPDATPAQIGDIIIRRARTELGTTGAAAGGLASVPGVGTGAAISASAADVTWTISRIAEMVLALGIAYGHTAAEIEERRAWVLAVLATASGAAAGLNGVAADLGKKGGVKIVKSIPMSQIVRLNRMLGGRVVVKWGTIQGSIRLGTIIPLGVGAAIGGGGNMFLVNRVGGHACNFFDDGLGPDSFEAGVVVSPSPEPLGPAQGLAA